MSREVHDEKKMQKHGPLLGRKNSVERERDKKVMRKQGQLDLNI